LINNFSLNEGHLKDEFAIIPRLFGEALTLLATSLRYKSDETYVFTQK
jgi:hypothetical protein